MFASQGEWRTVFGASHDGEPSVSDAEPLGFTLGFRVTPILWVLSFLNRGVDVFQCTLACDDVIAALMLIMLPIISLLNEWGPSPQIAKITVTKDN